MGRRQITREELYEAVWTKAVVRVAADFGVSDVAVGKVCRRLSVPLPPRGYWMKKKAGQNVWPQPLPPRPPGGPISASIGHWRDPITDAEMAEYDGAAPVFDEPMSRVLVRIGKLLGPTVVHKNLDAPHPIVAQLLEQDRKRKQDGTAWPYPSPAFTPLYESEGERRKLRLVSSVLATVELSDFPPYWDYNTDKDKPVESFGVTVGAARAYLRASVVKPSRRTSGVMEKSAVTVRVGSYGWDDVPIVNRTIIRDISMALIETGEESLRSWAIAHHERLLRRQTYQSEQQQRKAEEKARREQEAVLEAARIEAEKLAAEEQAKRDRLFAAAEAHRTAEGVREYVRQVQARATGEDAGEVEKWAAWALGVADEVDPMTSANLLADIPQGDC